jgi:hypothetical protein
MSPQIKAAENDLRKQLEHSFGPDLEGVVTFGHRVDPATHKQTLNVVLDAVSAPRGRTSKLPQAIGGFAVKVMRAGPPEF